MGKKKTPFMIDPSLYKMAGIDMESGLPSRVADGENLKASMRHILRLIDEQDAVPCIRRSSSTSAKRTWTIPTPP